ncbi:PsbP-related protein [Balneola sp. MJW-20]
MSQIASAQELFEVNKTYQSNRHSYSITVPKSFEQSDANRANIDLKFVDKFGSSIMVNVTPRQDQEYGITAHDYTEDLFENSIRQFSPNYDIVRSEKIIISGQKAFIVESKGSHPDLRTMECHLFYNDKAYVITNIAPTTRYSRYRNLFHKVITSLDLMK